MSGFVFNVTTGYPFRIDTWRTLFSKYPIITQFYRNFQSVSYSLGCYLALSTITLLEWIKNSDLWQIFMAASWSIILTKYYSRGQIKLNGCFMSVNNCQLTLPNNPDEARPQQHRGASLTPRLVGIQKSSLNTGNTYNNIKYLNYLIPGLINPLNPELNPICYLLALLGAHHFLHVSRIRVKLLTFRRLVSYIYGAPILDVSRSHTTTQHSR